MGEQLSRRVGKTGAAIARTTLVLVAIVAGSTVLFSAAKSAAQSSRDSQKQTQEQQRAAAARKAAAQGAIDARVQRSAAKWPAQDAELQLALAVAPGRSSVLPRWVRDVYIDPSAKAWFWTGGDQETRLEFRKSVEDAWAGKTRTLRGGRWLLIDSAGRFWVQCDSWPDSRTVVCYDGKNWVEHPPTKGSFFHRGWEDSARNVWFIAGKPTEGFESHRLSPGGKWEIKPLPESASNDLDLFRDEKGPAFVEQRDGTIVLCDRSGSGLAATDSGAVFYRLDAAPDGAAAWQPITTRVCTRHRVRFVLPLADGSIGTVCEGDRLWLDRALTAEDVAALVEKLGSGLERERDEATRELRLLVGKWDQVIHDAAQKTGSPEVRLRAAALLKGAPAGREKRPGGDAGSGQHPAQITYLGGRYALGECHPLCRDQSGRAILAAFDFQDRTTGVAYDQAVVTINADTSWSAVPVDPAKWDVKKLTPDSGEAYEDRSDRLWVKPPYRIEKDGTVIKAVRDELEYHHVVGQDADGRVYLAGKNVGFIAVDGTPPPAAPPPAGASAAATQATPGAAAAEDGGTPVGQTWQYRYAAAGATDGSAWAWLEGNDALQRFSAGKWEKAPAAPEGRGESLLPLKDGGMLVLFSRGDNHAAACDGRATWRAAVDLKQLIEKEHDLLRRIGPDDFAGEGPDLIAADAGGNIWLTGTAQLSCFDGRAWHDVEPEMVKQGQRPRGIFVVATAGADTAPALGRGTGVIIQDNFGNLWFLQLDAGTIKVTTLRRNPGHTFGKFIRKAVHAPTGEVLLSTALGGEVHRFATGKLQRSMAGQGSPLGYDAAGNLWRVVDMGKALEVTRGIPKPGEHGARLPLENVAGALRWLTSPDGKNWLVHANALLRVETLQDNGKLTARQTGRWTWPSPLAEIADAFFDDSGGFWVKGGNSQLTRYALHGGPLVASAQPAQPGAKSPATAPPVDPATAAALERAASMDLEIQRGLFDKTLRDLRPSYPKVSVGTTMGTCKWQKLVLNRAGKKLDAIRFTVPPGEPREMTWAFISPPRGVTAWFVLPVEGQMDMPEHFDFASGQADQWKGVEAPPRSTIMMQSWPARLDGGKEYIIWFKFLRDQPVEMEVAINNLHDSGDAGVQEALGLVRRPRD